MINREGMNKDVKKRLDVVDKAAKNYFKEEFGLSSHLSYSELAKDFEKKKRVFEVEFCRGMFESYYSDKELSNKKIEDLGDLLIRASRQKIVVKKEARVPGVFDKVDNFLGSVKNAVMGKIQGRAVVKREKEERTVRSNDREGHELLSWVKKAIRMEYDKKEVLDLLKKGKKSDKEIKKILKLYEKELKKALKDNAALPHEGIAQRIIRREKGRSEK